ncbi:MAG: outer membrane lipoprotein chaperone LolA, partial [Gammaproteobacteria bacterium]
MMKKILLPVLMTLPCFSAHAGQGEEQLRAFMDEVQSLQTEFTQDLYDEAGTKIDSASGMLYLQRPGKFHWQYQQPYEQQILTDGETLWIYDSDLEQVTVRDVANNLQSTPAAILGGTANIDELYEITDMGELEGAHWVRLSSLDDDSQYKDVRLGFEADELGMMIMSD